MKNFYILNVKKMQISNIGVTYLLKKTYIPTHHHKSIFCYGLDHTVTVLRILAGYVITYSIDYI